MLDRGEADPDRLSSLAVSLGFSLGSPRMRLPAPHAGDAPARLYAMLGQLPDGMAIDDADPCCQAPAAAATQRADPHTFGPHGRPRIRMLAPVREHAAGIDLVPRTGRRCRATISASPPSCAVTSTEITVASTSAPARRARQSSKPCSPGHRLPRPALDAFAARARQSVARHRRRASRTRPARAGAAKVYQRAEECIFRL